MVLEYEMKRTHLLLHNNLNMQKLTILSLCILLLAACSGTKKSTSAAATTPTSSISDKVKACKKNEGLFTLFQDTVNGSVYMLLKKEQLEKEYIYFSYSADGVVAAGHFRGSYRDNKVFTIKRYFDKIEFIFEAKEFKYPASNIFNCWNS
jgi:hypothetical protein